MKCDAIYARQSVDRNDSISIESQIEYCKYETRGAPCRVYSDKGYSGKNTERPEFQKMLCDIKNGEICRVICYKLDRCSRSILDFTTLLEELQKYSVEFISCTEKFDTSTPMGRAMLNICVVFAQLERETIQQRVTDAYRSRSQKGFYMGGRIPYGFLLEPCMLHGKKTSKYSICPEEAKILAQLYTQYANPQCSIGDLLQYCHANGIANSRTKDGRWNRSYLLNAIKNPIYVRADLDIYNFFLEQGVTIQDDPSLFIGTNGCYLYTNANSNKRKTLCLEGHNLVLAPHEGIIASDIWLQCRKKCNNQRQSVKPIKAKNSWLAGKLKCSICGHSLVIRKSSSKAQAKRYYMCSLHLNNSTACPGVGGISAEEAEEKILFHLREKVRLLGVLRPRLSSVQTPYSQDLKIKIVKARKEIDQLLSMLLDTDIEIKEYINRKISRLDQNIQNWSKELLLTEKHTSDISSNKPAIEDGMHFWDLLTLQEKMTVVNAMITRITASESNILIEWKV